MISSWRWCHVVWKKNYWHSESRPVSAAYFLLIICLAYSSTLNMETVYSSDALANFYRATRRHISEHSTLHSHRWEDLNSNIYSKRCMLCINYSGNGLLVLIICSSWRTLNQTSRRGDGYCEMLHGLQSNSGILVVSCFNYKGRDKTGVRLAKRVFLKQQILLSCTYSVFPAIPHGEMMPTFTHVTTIGCTLHGVQLLKM
jgi:hypothetical protein